MVGTTANRPPLLPLLKRLALSLLVVPSAFTAAMASRTPFLTKSSAAGTTVTVRFPATDTAANAEKEPPRFAVGYWSIKGLAAPLRMMLCAARRDHSVFMYDLVEKDGGGWKSDYFQEKPQLIEEYKVPLMNLPFVVDREERRVVCQSNACFAYLARQVGFWGSNEVEASECEELLCEIYDVRNIMVRFAYGGDGSKGEAESTMKAAQKHFAKLEAWLKLKQGDGSAAPVHLVGGRFSAPDFHLFEMVDQFAGLCSFYGLPDFFEDYPHLKAFKDGFEKLEENQFYLKSWLHTGLPFNNCSACFGSLPGPATYKHGESAEEAKSFRGKGDVTL